MSRVEIIFMALLCKTLKHSSKSTREVNRSKVFCDANGCRFEFYWIDAFSFPPFFLFLTARQNPYMMQMKSSTTFYQWVHRDKFNNIGHGGGSYECILALMIPYF